VIRALAISRSEILERSHFPRAPADLNIDTECGPAELAKPPPQHADAAKGAASHARRAPCPRRAARIVARDPHGAAIATRFPPLLVRAAEGFSVLPATREGPSSPRSWPGSRRLGAMHGARRELCARRSCQPRGPALVLPTQQGAFRCARSRVTVDITQ